jgi:adhesin HecA-like repeat protein
MALLVPSGLVDATGTLLIPGAGLLDNPAGTLTATITDAGDELYRTGDSVTITGTNFGAVEGDVYVSPTDDVTNASKVAQAVTVWADTSITFDAVRSTLATGSTLYLFVVPDTNDENADGYSVAFEYVPITLTWAM